VRTRPVRLAVFVLTGFVLGTFADLAWADPPPWAQAHGRRDHDEHRYRGYDGYEWDRDYGVYGGRCNTDDVLAVTGAVAGAVIGNRASSPENRTIATIVGAVIGGVVGNMVGESIDAGDRGCIGHTLEIAPPGRPVTWRNPRSGIVYYVTPARDLGGNCREFTLRSVRGGRDVRQQMRGCRVGQGQWRTELLPGYAPRGGDRDGDNRREQRRRY